MPVSGLATPGVEECFSGDTIKGATYATMVHTSTNLPYRTAVLAQPGDADIVATTQPQRPMPFSMSNAWDGHPTAVSSTVLVFASNRPGSLGGTDLWYVVTDKGQWSTPQPIHGLNTPCDELSPFYDAGTSTLHFASAGHATLGGYDVMQARIRIVAGAGGTDSVVADTPLNPGAPLNSPFDDLFPVVDGTTMYVTSDRRNGSDLDVYQTKKMLAEPTALTATPETTATPQTTATPETTATTTLRGTVVNMATNQAVADAEVTATNASTRTVVAASRTDTVGRYELQVPVETPVTITAQSSNLFYDSYDTTFPASTANRITERTASLALPSVFVLRVNFPTSAFDTPYAMTLDSNGSESAQPWQSALDLLADNVRRSGSTLRRLVLTGHTDDVDTDAKNRVLGQQRVNFVIDQLVLRGVPRSLLEGRSAGERELPERRTAEDVDTWRKRSRRVELVKVMQQ